MNFSERVRVKIPPFRGLHLWMTSSFALLPAALSRVAGIAGHCIHADCSLISHAPFRPFLLSLRPTLIAGEAAAGSERNSLA